MMNKHPFSRITTDTYQATRSFTKDEAIAFTRSLVGRGLQKKTTPLSNPKRVRDYLSLHLGTQSNEKFWALFLDNRHRVLLHEVLFSGTIDGAAVYPRVVVKRALEVNAAAIIFAHNHPSGVAEPSDADASITKKLMEALALVDIRVLDHWIVGHNDITSMAERGLL